MNIFSRLSGFLKKEIKPIHDYYVSWGGFKVFAKRELYFGIVFRCIDAIASEVSSIEYHLQRRKKNGDIENVDEHEIIDLMKRPNKHQTGADLLYQISSHIDAFGMSYVYAARNLAGTKPVELWALDPSKMRPVKSDDFISGWVYEPTIGKKVPFEVNEIIPIGRPNPFNAYEGTSTIEMARFEIEGDINAILWNKSFFENGATPSGVFTTEGDLDEPAFKRLKKQISQEYAGKGNAYKLMLLEGGLKFQQVALKQKDMDFIEQRKLNRDDLLAIFKVPKTVVAISDDVNRANAETGDYVFAKRTVEPRVKLIFEKLNVFLVPMFPHTEDLDLVFDSPVPEDQAFDLNRKTQAVNRWLTINEVRDEDNYEPLEGGDELYLPVNIMPAASDQNTTPPASGGKGMSQEKSLTIVKIGGKKKITARDNKYITLRDAYLAKKERQLQLKLKQHFKFLIRDIKNTKEVRAYKTKGVEDTLLRIVPNLSDWKGVFAEIVYKFNEDALKSGVANAQDSYNLPDNFSLEHSGAISFIKERVDQATDSVTSSLLDQARGIIAHNLEQDQTSISKIKEDIVGQLSQDVDWRVERIVRTELITAYGQGSYYSYVASDVVDELKWLTAEDERVCPICQPNDQKIVKIGEEFPSGNNHEPAHIQCRCTTVPYFGK